MDEFDATRVERSLLYNGKVQDAVRAIVEKMQAEGAVVFSEELEAVVEMPDVRDIVRQELRTALTPAYFFTEDDDTAWALNIITDYVGRSLRFHVADHHQPPTRISRLHQLWINFLGPVVMIAILIAAGILIGLVIGRAQ